MATTTSEILIDAQFEKILYSNFVMLIRMQLGTDKCATWLLDFNCCVLMMIWHPKRSLYPLFLSYLFENHVKVNSQLFRFYG